jgi:hypothetical protein
VSEQDLTPDVGDPAKVKRKKTKAQLEYERQVEELRQVLSTKGGRNVIWRFLSMTHLFQTPVGETNDIMRIVGAQDIGREMLASIFTSDPKAYILMQQEADDRILNKEKDDA